MDELAIYFTGIFLTLVSSIIVIIFLRKKFYQILVEITGNSERAGFWLIFSNALLILIPLVFSMSVIPESNDFKSVVFDITRQLRWGIIGIILTLVTLGFILISFINRK